MRSEVKALGLMDTAENLWDFFIEKVSLLCCVAAVCAQDRIARPEQTHRT